MKLNNEYDVIELVKRDEWMMNVLHAARTLQLPDWWVCAGFVRSKIWDTLHGFAERTPLPDVDVVYFDPQDIEEDTEKRLEKELTARNPDIPWSVKNEARMHLVSGLPPFTSTVDAISGFPETVTALGLSLGEEGEVLLAAPYGLSDVLDLTVRPTPYYAKSPEAAAVYERRVAQKNWERHWTMIQIRHTGNSLER